MVTFTNSSVIIENNLGDRKEEFLTSFRKNYIPTAMKFFNQALEDYKELENIKKQITCSGVRQLCAGSVVWCGVQILAWCVVPIMPVWCAVSLCWSNAREGLKEALTDTDGLCKGPCFACTTGDACDCCSTDIVDLFSRAGLLKESLTRTCEIFSEAKDPKIIHATIKQIEKFDNPRYLDAYYSVCIGMSDLDKLFEELAVDFDYEMSPSRPDRMALSDDGKYPYIYSPNKLGLLSNSIFSCVDDTIKVRKIVGDFFQNLLPRAIIESVVWEYIIDVSAYPKDNLKKILPSNEEQEKQHEESALIYPEEQEKTEHENNFTEVILHVTKK